MSASTNSDASKRREMPFAHRLKHANCSPVKRFLCNASTSDGFATDNDFGEWLCIICWLTVTKATRSSHAQGVGEMTSKRMVVFWVRTNCCQQRIAVDVLVPLPTSLLDLGIIAAHVVLTGVGDVQSPSVIQCCEPGPLEGSHHCRWSGAGMGTASPQPFKLHASQL